MRTVVAGLVAAFIALEVLSCSKQQDNTAGKNHDVAERPAKQIVAPPSATQVFKLRSDCEKLGEKLLAEHPSPNPRFNDGQVSRYNPVTNRCYVKLVISSADLSDPDYYLHELLYDGQTGEMLASFRLEGSGPSPRQMVMLLTKAGQ